MDYRRYGVGTALMNAFMEKAKSAGYKKLILWTASPLTDAIHQYEKLGFQRTDSVENHTWSTKGVLVVLFDADLFLGLQVLEEHGFLLRQDHKKITSPLSCAAGRFFMRKTRSPIQTAK